MRDESDLESKRVDLVRTQYAVATDMVVLEGHLIWSKFQAFMIFNSILVSALVAFDSTSSLSNRRDFVTAVAIAGTVLWFMINLRAWGKWDYWLERARLIEQCLPATGAWAHLFIDEDVRAKGHGTRASTHVLSQVVILMFLGVYIGLLIAP